MLNIPGEREKRTTWFSLIDAPWSKWTFYTASITFDQVRHRKRESQFASHISDSPPKRNDWHAVGCYFTTTIACGHMPDMMHVNVIVRFCRSIQHKLSQNPPYYCFSFRFLIYHRFLIDFIDIIAMIMGSRWHNSMQQQDFCTRSAIEHGQTPTEGKTYLQSNHSLHRQKEKQIEP